LAGALALFGAAEAAAAAFGAPAIGKSININQTTSKKAAPTVHHFR
jgi:hypothetical protein